MNIKKSQIRISSAIVIVFLIFLKADIFAQSFTLFSSDYLAEAEEYALKGEFTKAIELLNKEIQINTSNVEAHTILGRIYFYTGKNDAAKNSFEKAIQLEKNDAEANLGMSMALLWEGNDKKAKDYALVALGSNSTRIDALNILGQISVIEEDTDNAFKCYKQILNIDSTHYEALTNLGVLYQRQEDYKKALYYFKKAVKFYSNKSRAYHNLGILYSMLNRTGDAIINLNKASELDTVSSNSVRQLGIIYLQDERFSEAIETFDRALRRDNLDVESYLGKALAYWSLKDYDKVLVAINDMQTFGLRFNRLELFLADIYFKKNDYDKAIKYAQLDEEENSSKSEGHYLLGVLLKMKGEKEKAEFEFNEASAISGKDKNAPFEFDAKTIFYQNDGK